MGEIELAVWKPNDFEWKGESYNVKFFGNIKTQELKSEYSFRSR